MRQFASGDGAVVDQVVIGAGLDYFLAGERKRIRRGKNRTLPSQPHARRADDIIKRSTFGAHVVDAVAGLDVFVVGSTIEYDVAVHGGVPGFGVVGDVVGVEDVGSVMNFSFAVKLEDRTVFLLLQRADGNFFPLSDGRCAR